MVLKYRGNTLLPLLIRGGGEHSVIFELSSLDLLIAEVQAIMLVYSIFCDFFSLIYKVLIQEVSLILYLITWYRALSKQSFDTYFCSLRLSVAKIHVLLKYRGNTLLPLLIRGGGEHSVILCETNGHLSDPLIKLAPMSICSKGAR